MPHDGFYTISEVAERAGVHTDTVRRWVKNGKIPEPGRDRNDWRVFTEEELEEIVAYATSVKPSPRQMQSQLFEDGRSRS